MWWPASNCTCEGSREEGEENLLGADVFGIAPPLWYRTAPFCQQGSFIHKVCITKTLPVKGGSCCCTAAEPLFNN